MDIGTGVFTWLNRLWELARAEGRRRVIRDSATVFLGQIGTQALSLVSSILVARGLGPALFSHYAASGIAIMVGGTVADFGLSQSAVRYIAADEDDAVAPGETAVAFSRLKLVGALLVALLVALAAAPLATLLALPGDAGPLWLRVAALGIVATAVSGIMAGQLQALRRFRALVLVQLANVTLTVLLVLILVWRGRLTVGAALVVGAVTALAGAGVGVAALPATWRPWHARRRRVSRAAARAARRRLLAFSRWLWLSAVLAILVAQLDLLLVKRLLPAADAGHYALALNLAFKANLLSHSLFTVLLPAVSALHGGAAIRRYVKRAGRRLLLLAAPGLLLLPLAGPLLILLYGADFAPAVPIFYALMITVLFDLVVTPLLLLAYPLDLPRDIAAANALRVVVLLAAGSALIPGLGPLAAVGAKMGAKLVGAAYLGLAIRRRLRAVERGAALPTAKPPAGP